jgi:hypothetical protein
LLTRTWQRRDELRPKIAATKERGAITDEERIREHLGQLYGDLNQHEGRPTKELVARTDSPGRELDDVMTDFRKLTDTELPAINAGLAKRKREVISVLSEAD